MTNMLNYSSKNFKTILILPNYFSMRNRNAPQDYSEISKDTC